MGGGWMALCHEHGLRHIDYSPQIDILISQGETLEKPNL